MGNNGIMTAIYHRGTLAQFTTWHNAAKLEEGIPPEGRIGYVLGIPAPNNARTYNYSETIQNPGGGNNYLWEFYAYPDDDLPQLSRAEAEAAGWFPPEG